MNERKTLMARPKRPVIDRLMDKVREDENGCWVFEGSKARDGYGRIGDRGRMRPAHRVAYEYFNGPIGPGLDIDHMCFVRACVNPKHLRAITRKQNNEHQRSAQKNSASGVRGVSRQKGRSKPWLVLVRHNGKLHYGGYYATVEEAEAVAIKMRAELFTHDDYTAWEETKKELINE